MRKLVPVALAAIASVAAAFAALTLLASCAKQAPKTVTVYMWSEYIDPELLVQFEKETGQKVVLDTYENTETMMAKLASASPGPASPASWTQIRPAPESAVEASPIGSRPKGVRVSPTFVNSSVSTSTTASGTARNRPGRVPTVNRTSTPSRVYWSSAFTARPGRISRRLTS